jgi:4-hydroxyproline epimerase
MAVHEFECIDAHCCGNPVRVVATGGPVLKGQTMSEKRHHFMREYDWIRRGLMFEPRGHDMMSGSIFYQPTDPSNDIAILFIETSGCLPMCGHGTIGSITIGIEEGLIQPREPGKVRLETPAGLVLVTYKREGDSVLWVRIANVPSFLAASNLRVKSTLLGELKFDVAYGGNFYAIIDPQENFEGMEKYSANELIHLSRELRGMMNSMYPGRFVHPTDPTIRDISHIMWTGRPLDPSSTGRNAVFYGEKAIDRSPCGTGTSARMAQWHAKGMLQPGEDFIHESIIGSRFTGQIEKVTTLGKIEAIIPGIQGWAKVYGHNRITIDEDDPFALGFQVV